MARYWVGDLHLGHTKVAKIRYPDASDDDRIVAHHDMVIYDQLKRLSADDQVWILGDISSGRPEGEDRALQLLSEISAGLHLIAGNHDSVSSIHRNGYKQQRRYLKTFETVQDFARVRLHGEMVYVSHYPYARSGDGPDRGKARYLEWRLPDLGNPLIHAHTHQRSPHMPITATNINSNTPVSESGDLSQMCVSWDVRRGLTSEEDMNSWLKQRRGELRTYKG